MYTQDLTSVDLRESSRLHSPGGLRDIADLAGGGVGVCEEGEVPWADRGLSTPSKACLMVEAQNQASWSGGPSSPGETLVPSADSRAILASAEQDRYHLCLSLSLSLILLLSCFPRPTRCSNNMRSLQHPVLPGPWTFARAVTSATSLVCHDAGRAPPPLGSLLHTRPPQVWVLNSSSAFLYHRGQTVSIFDFAGYRVSVPTCQVCSCIRKAATDNP